MRYTRHLSILLALLVIIPSRAFSLEVPQLKARVNDYAGILSPAVSQKIEERLALLEQTDSTQVVVLTIPSLEGDVLEDFSIKVAEKWKIGQRMKDNGVILLVARDDRKVRIEVGRGLEGKLTDLVSGRIIRNTIIPNFKKGDFDNGILEGTGDIINVVKGEYVATKDDAENRKKGFGFEPGIFFLLIILAGPIIGLVSVISRKSKLLGGAAGGAVGSAVGYFGFLSSLLGLGIFGIIGLIIGVLLGFMRGTGAGSWGGHGGSSFGGGGFSGGGGGFSGGGGSFGGGGSSGSW